MPASTWPSFLLLTCLLRSSSELFIHSSNPQTWLTHSFRNFQLCSSAGEHFLKAKKRACWFFPITNLFFSSATYLAKQHYSFLICTNSRNPQCRFLCLQQRPPPSLAPSLLSAQDIATLLNHKIKTTSFELTTSSLYASCYHHLPPPFFPSSMFYT